MVCWWHRPSQTCKTDGCTRTTWFSPAICYPSPRRSFRNVNAIQSRLTIKVLVQNNVVNCCNHIHTSIPQSILGRHTNIKFISWKPQLEMPTRFTLFLYRACCWSSCPSRSSRRLAVFCRCFFERDKVFLWPKACRAIQSLQRMEALDFDWLLCAYTDARKVF